MKRLRVLDHQTLLALNNSSIRAGRLRTLPPVRLLGQSHRSYPVSINMDYQRASQPEIRLCIVIDAAQGQTAWLDVSPEEFATIPEVEVSELEWEAVQCAGTPPL